MQYKIVEHSWIARIASMKLNEQKMAIVFGQTIYLHGTSKLEFINDARWLKHELEHIRQYKQYGFIRFIGLYLIESWRQGYHNNKFEIAARKAEET
jgi:hypothetical protein